MLGDIPPAPRGIPQIEVTFDIDANGIVNVSAKDNGTGKSQKITITSSSGLSDEDIEKMVSDAEANEEEDKKRKEAVEVRNEADQLVYTTDKTIKDLGDKVEQTEIDKANAAKEKVTEALAGEDTEAIKTATAELSEIVQQLSVKLYEQMAAEQQANEGAEAGAEGEEKNKDNVVDAEYEEINDDDKKENESKEESKDESK